MPDTIRFEVPAPLAQWAASPRRGDPKVFETGYHEVAANEELADLIKAAADAGSIRIVTKKEYDAGGTAAEE